MSQHHSGRTIQNDYFQIRIDDFFTCRDISIPLNGVSVTSGNAQRIGAAVVNAADTLQAAMLGTGTLTGASLTLQADRFNLPDFILQQLQPLSSLDPLPGGSVTGVAVSQTLSCPDGGSVNLSGEVADPNTLTVDDTVNFAYSNLQYRRLHQQRLRGHNHPPGGGLRRQSPLYPRCRRGFEPFCSNLWRSNRYQ